jgi:hypothetical protein
MRLLVVADLLHCGGKYFSGRICEADLYVGVAKSEPFSNACCFAKAGVLKRYHGAMVSARLPGGVQDQVGNERLRGGEDRCAGGLSESES